MLKDDFYDVLFENGIVTVLGEDEARSIALKLQWKAVEKQEPIINKIRMFKELYHAMKKSLGSTKEVLLFNSKSNNPSIAKVAKQKLIQMDVAFKLEDDLREKYGIPKVPLKDSNNP